MTVHQRDVFAVYCLLANIKKKEDIQEKLDDYLQIRELIAEICMEIANEENVHE